MTEYPILDYQQKMVESLDLTSDQRVVAMKARRRSPTSIYAALAMTAPPGFMGTAEAMMGSPYKPPVAPQPDSERVAKLQAAEQKRQRRLERNKRNRSIRGSL